MEYPGLAILEINSLIHVYCIGIIQSNVLFLKVPITCTCTYSGVGAFLECFHLKLVVLSTQKALASGVPPSHTIPRGHYHFISTTALFIPFIHHLHIHILTTTIGVCCSNPDAVGGGDGDDNGDAA